MKVFLATGDGVPYVLLSCTTQRTNRPNQMTTTTKSRQQIKLIISDIDGQNRKFLWSAYSDGSAMTREITQHLTHACSTTETFREEHPAGSEMAEMIHAMPCA